MRPPALAAAKNWRAVAAVLNSLGKIENDNGRDAEALRYFNQSLEASFKLNYPVGLGTTFNNIGKIYYQRKDYAQALQYYNRALEFFVAGGDRERARMVMGNVQLAENQLTGDKPADPAMASPGIQEKPSEEIVMEPPQEVTIKKDRLNLYESPSTGSTVKGRILAGGIYPILDRFQGAGPEEVFFKIQLNSGKIGWLYGP